MSPKPPAATYQCALGAKTPEHYCQRPKSNAPLPKRDLGGQLNADFSEMPEDKQQVFGVSGHAWMKRQKSQDMTQALVRYVFRTDMSDMELRKVDSTPWQASQTRR